jgi:hypothetical protein
VCDLDDLRRHALDHVEELVLQVCRTDGVIAGGGAQADGRRRDDVERDGDGGRARASSDSLDQWHGEMLTVGPHGVVGRVTGLAGTACGVRGGMDPHTVGGREAMLCRSPSRATLVSEWRYATQHSPGSSAC